MIKYTPQIIPVVFPGDAELSRLQGMPIRLEFTMSDADLYSMCFDEG